MIRTDKDDIELLLIHPVYIKKIEKIRHEDGIIEVVEKQVLKKELRVARWLRKEAIVSVQQYITSRNTIAKGRCLVMDRYTNQFFAVFHSVDDVREAARPKVTNVQGFNYVSKVQSGGSQL